jgi:hypothetical protein
MESRVEEKSQTSRTAYICGLDRQYAWLPVEKAPLSSEKCCTISISPYIFLGNSKNLFKWIKFYIFFQADNYSG